MLNTYINKIDLELKELTTFFLISLDLEKKITQNIEEMRQNKTYKSKLLNQLLIDYRNFTFNLRIII